MIDPIVLAQLDAPRAADRLDALGRLLPDAGFPEADPRMINNHIHTIYSFSPYSPTAAVYAARAEGLCTAGIVDHDSVAGAREFLAAGEKAGIPTTVGVETRVSMAGTPFEAVRTNNPDQAGVSYMAMHGLPHDRIEEVQRWFAPYRERRNVRNRAMTARIDQLLSAEGFEVQLDFDMDVLPLSQAHEGGTVTERHLCLALAKVLIAIAGRGEGLVRLLEEFESPPSASQRKTLLDVASPFYEYDVLNVLKSAFLPKVYLPATDECPPLDAFVAFARRIGAIPCYAYLGDVTESVTGDKAAQKFEDAFLEPLFETLASHGVKAVTYMPTRNTPAQLDRLRSLCARLGFFEVSGEDINSPRQRFRIRAMEDPRFAHLIDATWALIAHERGERPLLP